jgi:hypothetical protein
MEPLPDALERDLRPFADPATDVELLANAETARIKLIRDGANYVIDVAVDTGKIRLKRGSEDEPTEREFSSLRSLLASAFFSNIQVLADNQRRLLEAQRVTSFIEPEGTIGGEPLSLEAFVREAGLNLGERQRPIELLLLDGAAGVGKTSLISQLVASRAHAYGRDSNEPPVLHVANRGRRLVSLDELIALSIQLVRGRFTYDQVPALIRNGVLQIAVDGFDELVDADGYADTWSVLREFLNDIQAGGPIILAGRDTFFDLAKFHERLQDLNERTTIRHARLSPISPEAGKKWLRSVGWPSSELESEELAELLKPESYVLRPYFLSTVAPLGGLNSILSEITSPREFLVKRFLEREAELITQRVKLSEDVAVEHLWKLFELIALEMAEAETEAVDLPFLQLAVDLIFEPVLPDRTDLAKLRHKAGSFALMDLDVRPGFRRFPHTEISNHFLASALIKDILDGKTPRFLRRGYFGTDLLLVVGEQMLTLSADRFCALRSRLNSLSHNDVGSERLSDNSVSLLITSAVVDLAERVVIERASAGDVVLFGTVGAMRLQNVVINRFDCRGADLTALEFADSMVTTLVVDDQTRFGSTVPTVGNLMIESMGKTSTVYAPDEIRDWLRSRRGSGHLPERDTEATRLLERLCRVFLRQFFIKSDPLDPAGRYLSDPIWPAIEQLLSGAGRLRRNDRKDASGRRGEFIHIINAAALLESASEEDRRIWEAVADLTQS